MIEKIMKISAVPSYLTKTLQANTVKVSVAGNVITIVPMEEGANTEKKYSCPFLGIAKDSNLTVEKFLDWKQKERAAEYEKELHS